MVRKSSATDDKSQIEGFREIARDLECDESLASLDSALGKIGKAKTPPQKKTIKAPRYTKSPATK